MIPALPADRLRLRLPEDALPFDDTRAVAPSDGIVGQERALRAVRQAVAMERPGFNLFVTGLSGGGRLRTVSRILEGLVPRRRQRRDFVYVADLDDPSRPRLLILPAGAGPRLRRAVAELQVSLKEEIPRILEGEAVRTVRDRLVRDTERAQREAILALRERLRARGFDLGGVDDGAEDPDGGARVVLRTADGTVGRAEAHLLAHEGKLERPLAEVEADFDVLEDDLARTLAGVRGAADAASDRVEGAEEAAIREGTKALFAAVEDAVPAARRWLRRLHDGVVDHSDAFVDDAGPALPFGGDAGGDPDTALLLRAFVVNVLHRGGRSRRAPIVVVPDPTYANLFGGVATDPTGGRGPDHAALRAGALHDADGGFLVLNAVDLASEAGAYKTLKRAMMFGELGLQNLDAVLQGATAALRPDPAPLDVKVVLVGDELAWEVLNAEDPDFASAFKLKAEFAEAVRLGPGLPAEMAAFLARMGARESLKPVDRDGVAALIETAVRRAGNGPRVSLAFGALADLYREADYLAESLVVGRADVRAALAARAERHGSSMRLAREAVMDGQLHIATTGAIVGQVNGLAVHDAGGHSWGHPLRITATVGAARAPGIVHIDREAGLSGASHDKGVQVLVGWLLGRFGRDRVLTLRAHLAIEQSHFFIDGDSASAAELIALLSAVSGLPVRQDRAITGAVDQLGGLRPIGGVNEKIEGFHRLVVDRGAVGCPGVVVPLHNVGDLSLDEELVAAVAAGRFAVWAAASLEEAAEVLFDRPFAEVCAAVERALDALAVVAFRRPRPAALAAAEE